MLKREVIDLINSGDVWVFVGAGASADAGLPIWSKLVERIVNKLGSAERKTLLEDWRYLNAVSDGNFPRVFSQLERTISRDGLERRLADELEIVRLPKDILRMIAQWPVRGYITSNYDSLVQTALKEIGQWKGWIEVGNETGEVNKLSGNAKHVVWHIHGALNKNPRSHHLIITERDYDELYLESSSLSRQLISLLTMSRVLFVGFGFQDPELLRLFRLVKKYSNPARPAYAFIGGRDHELDERHRLEYFNEYNVDVIPYLIKGNSHEQLTHVLRVYSAFILKRTQKFGQSDKPCPSYDSQTTALLVYNKLVLQKRVHLKEQVLISLAKSRILSLLLRQSTVRVEDLVLDLGERVRLLRSELPLEDASHNENTIREALLELDNESYVTISDTVELTAAGRELLQDQHATSERIYLQFRSHLEGRARQQFPTSEPDAHAVANAAESFIKDCIEKRALGIALAGAFGDAKQQFHITGLLQHLPEFMEQLTQEQALQLVSLVEDILANPSEEEAKYVGVALQAQFSLNLLGYSPALVETRFREIQNTAFVIDASMLLRLLARGCKGHEAASLLLRRLSESGCCLLTTSLLIHEVAEHALWVKDHLRGRDILSPEALMALTGKAGYRSNVFLEGYIVSRNAGKVDSFDDYMDMICADTRGHKGTEEIFERVLSEMGIRRLDLDEWNGFVKSLWHERDELQGEITERRKGGNTFTHDRQTQAEAEAVIIIEQIRRGIFSTDSMAPTSAYFVSNTRVIDKVRNEAMPITIRPNAILQWLSTISPSNEDELATLTSGILWELSERGFDVIDRRALQQVFNPLTSAAREQLPQQMEKYRTLTAVEYGEGSEEAFRQLDDLELPIALNSYFAQRAKILESQLADARRARIDAEKKVNFSDKERHEYERLKAKRDQRKRKSKGKAKNARTKK